MANTRVPSVSVIFKPDELAVLRQICKEDDRSMNWTLRRAFAEYVERRQEKDEAAN